MPRVKAKLLLVDDDVQIHTLLSALLVRSGYRVLSAYDGFSALAEIRNEIPDIILSDLNMPGMSGFELLSVVRRRFPAIRAIAMSGAFPGDGVPVGVAAEAFYEKGTNPGALLRIVEAVTRPERLPLFEHGSRLAPIWLASKDHSGEEYVVIACPECLRTFPQVLGETDSRIREACCAHCNHSIHYAIVQGAAWAPVKAAQRDQSHSAALPTASGVLAKARS